MNETELRAAVVAALACIAPELDERALRADLPLRRQIELDSIDWVNVLAALEERLGIRLPAAGIGPQASVDDIVRAAARAGALERAGALPQPPAAPLPREHHVVNGVPVQIRPVGADDLAREAAFVRQMSSEARYKRFMVTVNELPKSKLRYLTDVDQQRHVALAAVVDRDGEPAFVGVARYVVDEAGTGCEFAVAVDDRWKGSGLAGILMQALIGVAQARGLLTMEGLVLATNTRMLRFVRQLGFRLATDPDDRSTVRAVRSLQPAAGAPPQGR